MSVPAWKDSRFEARRFSAPATRSAALSGERPSERESSAYFFCGRWIPRSLSWMTNASNQSARYACPGAQSEVMLPLAPSGIMSAIDEMDSRGPAPLSHFFWDKISQMDA